MTKAEWISVIRNTLSKIDETGIYREPLVERHIQSVYEQMFNEVYRSNPRGFSKYCIIANSDTNTTGIAQNLSNGYDLPKIPIMLPRTGGGVFGVTSKGGLATSVDFVVTTYEGYKMSPAGVFGTSAFDTIGFKGRYACTILNSKVYANSSLENNQYLEVRMIPKFTEFALTDEVMIPEGYEEMLIDRVIDTLRHMTPVDLLNDNTTQ